MLNLDFRPTFTRTATFLIPSGRGFAEQTCEVTFEALTIDEFMVFDLDTVDLDNPKRTRAFLERVVVGLGDVVDQAGNAIPYSTAVRDALIGHDWGRRGLVEAYVRGRQQAAEGN